MLQFLKFLGYLAVLLAVVPLAGLCATGSLRQAWAYTKMWLTVVGGMAAAGFVVFAVLWAIIPAPG